MPILSRRGTDMQGYSRWSLRHRDDQIRLFLYQLPHIPIASRKVLLCLTRVQRFSPGSNPYLPEWTRFQARFDYELREHHFVPYPDRHTFSERTVHQIIDPLRDYFQDPVCAGYLSLHIRSSPYVSYEDIPGLRLYCRS